MDVVFSPKKKAGFTLKGDEDKKNLIIAVAQGSPADKKGVKPGYKIIKVGGVKVNTNTVREELKKTLKGGKKFKVRFIIPKKLKKHTELKEDKGIERQNSSRYIFSGEQKEEDTSPEDDIFKADIAKLLSVGKMKQKRLREMDLFILDCSMTLASVRSQTVANKRAIHNELKKAKIEYYIIESFTHETQIGDKFLKELNEADEDLSNAFAIVELWEKIEDWVPRQEISVGLRKCKRFGIQNVMLQLDLIYYKIHYDTFDMEEVCNYLFDKIAWIRDNLSKEAIILVNLRDFSKCMMEFPQRVASLVNFLATLPAEQRIFGISYEDMGTSSIEELSAWTKAVRNEMDRCEWQNGQLIVHVHEQWGMANAINMECLAMGATGIRAGMCGEGVALGHADSTTTLINLITLGNTQVQTHFNCKYFRKAAIEITKILTGHLPDPRQPVYGERALDMLFGGTFAALVEGQDVCDGNFDMAEFLGVKREVRITTMASGTMIALKLKEVFGTDTRFTEEVGDKMRLQIIKNAADGRKEEYNSEAGLAMLFSQSGGKLTEKMIETVNRAKDAGPYISNLIKEIKKEWDDWDGRDEHDDDHLTFDDFYIGFMAPYFGCYRCEDSQKGLKIMDFDGDGMIEWSEFEFYLLWAGRQYPDVKNSKQLIDFAFRKGLIPTMMPTTMKEKREMKENDMNILE